MLSNKRTNRIDLRIHQEAKETLQAAALLRHKSVSEFVLESALGAVDEVLADRRFFSLNAARWSAFQAALDAKPQPLPCLERLMSEPGFFDSAHTAKATVQSKNFGRNIRLMNSAADKRT